MQAAIRRRRSRLLRKDEFDLTPMIDVTFQLLIFFIIAMKFKQVERRHAADLPMDEGPWRPSEPVENVTLRMQWQDQHMVYAVDTDRTNSLEQGRGLISGGTLADLMGDRTTHGNPHYSGVFANVRDRLAEALVNADHATKVQIAMANDTSDSSALQVDRTAPWGFVTLAVDACTAVNRQRKIMGKPPVDVTFKNTEPGLPILR